MQSSHIAVHVARPPAWARGLDRAIERRATGERATSKRRTDRGLTYGYSTYRHVRGAHGDAGGSHRHLIGTHGQNTEGKR